MTRGQLINLKVWQRVVTDAEVMRKYDAVGISEELLNDLIKAGVNLIRVIRTGVAGTVVYYCCPGQFFISGLKHEYIPGDVNYFLPFKSMLLQNTKTQTRLI